MAQELRWLKHRVKMVTDNNESDWFGLFSFIERLYLYPDRPPTSLCHTDGRIRVKKMESFSKKAMQSCLQIHTAARLVKPFPASSLVSFSYKHVLQHGWQILRMHLWLQEKGRTSLCALQAAPRCMPQSLLNRWNPLDTKWCVCQKKNNVFHAPKLMAQLLSLTHY